MNAGHVARLHAAFVAVADAEGRTSYNLAHVARIAKLSLEDALSAMDQLIPQRIEAHKFGWVVKDMRSQQTERPPQNERRIDGTA